MDENNIFNCYQNVQSKFDELNSIRLNTLFKPLSEKFEGCKCRKGVSPLKIFEVAPSIS